MVEQGEVLKIEGINHEVVVVSNNRNNASNRVVVCPLINSKKKPTLSVEYDDSLIACDTIKQLDLDVREYSHTGQISMGQLIKAVDMVQSIFDYY